MKGYDIKVRLDDFRPLTWRDLIIPENITFHQLHLIMQELWDLYDMHLYEFSDKKYTKKFIDFDRFAMDNEYIPDYNEYNAKEYCISILFDSYKKIDYTYDFGDSWYFTIEIKKKVDYEENYPYLKRFKGEYNPIEDCGGIWGLSNIINSYDESKVNKRSNTIDLEEKRDDLKNNCTFNNPSLKKEITPDTLVSDFSCMMIINVDEKMYLKEGKFTSDLTFKDIHEIITNEEKLDDNSDFKFINKENGDIISKEDADKIKIGDYIKIKETFDYEYDTKNKITLYLKRDIELVDYFKYQDFFEK